MLLYSAVGKPLQWSRIITCELTETLAIPVVVPTAPKPPAWLVSSQIYKKLDYVKYNMYITVQVTYIVQHNVIRCTSDMYVLATPRLPFSKPHRNLAAMAQAKF